MCFQPELHFDYLHPREWNGKKTKDVAIEVNDMEQKMKKAIGYNWANHHVYIDDICGKPAISIQFYDRNDHCQNHVDMWNARNGVSMGSFDGDIWLPEWSDMIDKWCWEINKGLTMCNKCGKWVKEINHYSFAGGVCNKCYNPKVHLGPDTRGD